MAPRSGEEGRSAYARWPVGPRAPRPYGRIGFSKTIDSGTAARPGNPRRLPGIGDETTLNTCSALDQNGARMTSKPELIGRDSQFLYFAESTIAWINREPNPRIASLWQAIEFKS